MRIDQIIKKASRYFSEIVLEHGSTPYGVGWNSVESQNIRYDQLLKVIDQQAKFSVNDLGCGYGVLIDYMIELGYTDFNFVGLDISKEMILAAQKKYKDQGKAEFIHIKQLSEIPVSDYTVASGVFNMKLDVSEEEWKVYVVDSINQMNDKSKRGFSFNMLTSYSDDNRIRDDLYYGDPLYFFDYCKKNFSNNIALLHDYELYDFTILIRK